MLLLHTPPFEEHLELHIKNGRYCLLLLMILISIKYVLLQVSSFKYTQTTRIFSNLYICIVLSELSLFTYALGSYCDTVLTNHGCINIFNRLSDFVPNIPIWAGTQHFWLDHMCSQRRFGSACASTQADQSSLYAWKHFGSLRKVCMRASPFCSRLWYLWWALTGQIAEPLFIFQFHI